ncbi:MAG: sulfatase-like hydrolase/transferase [Phycisphaerae bacterium]|nr:sulfatase-like hydrolase/transferase [Phycisphaerae bacterium]
MNRREFLKMGLAATAAIAMPGCTGVMNGKNIKKPNIVLFLVDDMGWQDTSVPFYKELTPFNKTYKTPNMEKLAAEGMKFTRAYASCVCSPTRVSLMTGLNAARHRVTNWTLRKDATNDARHKTLEFKNWNYNGLSPVAGINNTVHAKALPAYLKEAGYRTIHCGKAHFGAIGTPAAEPLNIGFDVNIAGHAAGGPGSYHGKHNFSPAFRNGDRIWDIPGLEEFHGQDIFLTEALTIKANRAVDESIEMEKPFFLYMAHYAIHAPIEQDDRFAQAYLDKGMHPIEARYAALIEGMDKSLGDIVANLEKHGQLDNTIILFMSDNGGLSAHARGGKAHTHNKPLSSGKGSAHEGGVRVPMIVKWPGVTEKGSKCFQPVIIEDYFPTILELAGVKDYKQVGGVIDGESFTLLLQGAKIKRKARKLYWHFPNNWGPTGPGIGPHSAIMEGDWKLIYYHADRSYELFDLRKDIGESKNLAKDKPEKVKQLAMALRQYLIEVDAKMPLVKATGKAVAWPGE